MDLQKIEAILKTKLCPKCNAGMVRETKDKVYECGYSRCGEVFDLSFLSLSTIHMLLIKAQTNKEKK